MREIKFRGIPIFGKHFVYGSLIIDMNEKGEETFTIRRNQNGKVSYFEVISETVGQYTGLKDKNGVDIYEFMEIDNIYEVEFNTIYSAYILTNISNGDIISLSKYIGDKDGQIEITKEYTKV